MSSSPDAYESRAKEMAKNARGTSVSKHTLLKDTGFRNLQIETLRPLISYLAPDEQPHYIHKLSGHHIDISRPEFNGASKVSGAIMFTDRRIVIVSNDIEGDRVTSIPYSDIESVQIDSKGILYAGGKTSTTVQIEFGEGSLTVQLSWSRKITQQVMDYVESRSDKQLPEMEFERETIPADVTYVCTDCRSEINPDAKRCPSCGYSPSDSRTSTAWTLTGLALSWSPIGWAMMAKSAGSEVAARASISDEIIKEQRNESNSNNSPSSLADELSQIADLHEAGLLSDEEFAKAKQHILDNRG